MVSQQLFDAVPFYAGLTLDAIGGRGVRWPEGDAVATWPTPAQRPETPAVPAGDAEANGRLRLGTFRTVWDGPEVAHAPALAFLAGRAHVELSPHDAQRLELFHGDRVVVESGGSAVQATVNLRAAVPAGSAFLEGNGVDGPLVEIRKAPSAQPALAGAFDPSETT
jgi:NADH-quinone oxidoreductase subunit G